MTASRPDPAAQTKRVSTRWRIPRLILIVVGVALDFVQQVESHLISHQYEGFTGPKGPKIRGRATVAARPR